MPNTGTNGAKATSSDTYLNEFVFCYDRHLCRHASFETILGLASRHHLTSYWDIIGRDSPRIGVATVRRQPWRGKTASGVRQDGSNLPQNSGTSPASRLPAS